MPVRDLPLFVLMAILWGIPYALIAVALGGFDGEFVVWARVAIAAVALVAIVGPRALWRCLHGRLLEVCGFSVVQFTVPLLLVTESERSVPSSLVGCLIASEPLWVAVLSVRVDRAQGSSPIGVAGLVSGIAGVAILLGAETSGSLAGAGLVMAASASYAWATLLVGRFAASMPLLHLVAGALAVSALTLFPFAVAAWPSGRPSLFAVTALVALAGVCTAVAFPLWFRLIAHVGAARAALVTYVSPVVAAALGIAMLGERPGPLAPLGLLLVLGGSWLATRSQGRRVEGAIDARRTRRAANGRVEDGAPTRAESTRDSSDPRASEGLGNGGPDSRWVLVAPTSCSIEPPRAGRGQHPCRPMVVAPPQRVRER